MKTNTIKAVIKNMGDFKYTNTIFDHEDIVFDKKSGKVLKISKRFQSRLGEKYASIKTIEDFDRLTSFFSNSDNNRKTLVKPGAESQFHYTIHLEGKEHPVKEVCWFNSERQSYHAIIYFGVAKHLFELPYDSLVEIIEKMESPALLFDKSLEQLLMVNPALLPYLIQPITELVNGFVLEDFHVHKDKFTKIKEWIQDDSQATLNLETKLYLEKKEGAWFEMQLFKVSPAGEILIVCALTSIDTLKASDQKVLRTNELLSKVVEVQSLFLSKSDGAKPYDLLLKNILNVIDAGLGFVGKVNVDLTGKKVLKIHAATDISINGPTAARLYQDYVKNDFLFRHFDNLFGACITEGKTILENDPPGNPHTKGEPIPGHPTISNFLGIPILKGEQVIGLIGLGNKKEGFTNQDIDDLKPFVSTYSVIIEAFIAEQDKIKFEQESNQKALILEKIAVHSPDLIVVLDEKLSFEFISPHASQFFDDKIELEFMHQSIKSLVTETLNEEYRVAGKRYRSRLNMDLNEIGNYWVESNINILEEGEHRKIIAVIRDVSKQIKTEQTLKESLTKEKQFNSFVSDFMNIVSHEFKTPLATIMSSMELSGHYLDKISDSSEALRLKHHYGKIEKELENLHKLIIHSMDYERFVSNSPSLKKQKVDLKKFIQEVLIKYEFTNKILFSAEIPVEFTVELDKFLIKTCLVNLISNALKYGGKAKKPELGIYIDGEAYKIVVRDFGVGIHEEDLPYIFTPFYRGTNTTGIAGSGFGLVAVKNFVELHQGKISINSEINEGTEFIITFPVDFSTE